MFRGKKDMPFSVTSKKSVQETPAMETATRVPDRQPPADIRTAARHPVDTRTFPAYSLDPSQLCRHRRDAFEGNRKGKNSNLSHSTHRAGNHERAVDSVPALSGLMAAHARSSAWTHRHTHPLGIRGRRMHDSAPHTRLQKMT